MIGHVFRDRYRIVAKIGQGGMGTVFLAEDQRLNGRRVALKVLHASGEWSAEAARRLGGEAEVLARLDHPALPSVSDFFADTEPGGGPVGVLVMDYVAGQDLGEIVKEARRKGRFLPEAQVLGWAEALCDVLTYLHLQEPPVLHRDVKPANIKLAPDGTIKLVDFGIALQGTDTEQTMTGAIPLGTLPYLPLEQYGADLSGHDPRADVYALGATLYHLLTGQQPPSAQERFLQPTRFLPPSTLVPTLAPHVERAVLRAMALKPEERPASAQALKQALLHGTGEAITPSEAATLAQALRANRELLVLVGLLLVAALVVTLR